MPGNFVQLRRGVRQHVLDGRISLLQFGAYCLILIGADAKDGTWVGSAKRLAGEADISESSADGILGRLCEAGYISSLRVRGQRGNRPYAIDKYLITVGPMTGRYVSAAESAKQGQVCYYATDDKTCDENSEENGDENRDTTFYSRSKDNKTPRQQENQSSREGQTASPGISPESETPDRPPVDVEPKATATTPDLPVYERAEDVPDSDKPRCLASRLWVCLGKPKHHEPKLRVWANDLRPCLEQFEFLEMWQAMKWATLEDTFWPGVIKGAANWAKNVEKIMDAYHAHLRGKANYERSQKQKADADSKKNVKKAPANYGSGVIVLEGTEEL